MQFYKIVFIAIELGQNKTSWKALSSISSSVGFEAEHMFCCLFFFCVWSVFGSGIGTAAEWHHGLYISRKKGFTFLRFKEPEIKVHSVVINNECPSTVRELNEKRID